MVHVELGEVEGLTLQLCLKRCGDLAELCRLQALLTQGGLALTPHLFDGILLRVVWGEGNQGQAPFLRGRIPVDRGEKLADLLTTMPAGVVPTDRAFRRWIAVYQLGQKVCCCHTFGFGVGCQMHLAGLRVNPAIQGLARREVANWHGHPFIPLAPGIPTEITPEEKALVPKQQHPLTTLYGVVLCGNVGSYRFALGRDRRVVFFGLLACTFLWRKPASFSRVS